MCAYSYVTSSLTRLKIRSRVQKLQAKLDKLLELDKRRGESRFFLSIDSHRAAGQVEAALKRNALSSNLPFFLLIAGESASGKTTLSTFWSELLNSPELKKYPSKLGAPRSQYISLDNYYRDNSLERAKYTELGGFYRNFDVDDPAALDLKLAARHINLLNRGSRLAIPRHDIATGVSVMSATHIKPVPFILVEGLFATTSQLTDDFEDVPHLQVFVSTSAQEIQRRWFTRIEQMAEAVGWKVPEAERPFYFDRVKKAAKKHILPTKNNADIVINGESPEGYRTIKVTQLSHILLEALWPL